MLLRLALVCLLILWGGRVRAMIRADLSGLPSTSCAIDDQLQSDGEVVAYRYGYRYYAPEVGRLASRDPIGEQGCLKVNAMFSNDMVNRLDYVGLWNKAGCWTVNETLGVSGYDVFGACLSIKMKGEICDCYYSGNKTGGN